MARKQNNDFIETSNFKLYPLKDDKGNILNDMDFIDKSLQMIEEYESAHKEPFPAPIKFIEYLKEVKENSILREKDPETGNETIKPNPNFNIVDYKKRTIQKTVNYDQLQNVK